MDFIDFVAHLNKEEEEYDTEEEDHTEYLSSITKSQKSHKISQLSSPSSSIPTRISLSKDSLPHKRPQSMLKHEKPDQKTSNSRFVDHCPGLPSRGKGSVTEPSLSDRNKKRRGRPPKVITGDIPTAEDIIPEFIGDSVKSILCFAVGCTHSYVRPGSNIVERSDRTLEVDKFHKFIIRACKRHHEHWKKLGRRPNVCDLCFGFNSDAPPKHRQYLLGGMTLFSLCNACARRQSIIMKLKLDPATPEPVKEQPTSPPSTYTPFTPLPSSGN